MTNEKAKNDIRQNVAERRKILLFVVYRLDKNSEWQDGEMTDDRQSITDRKR